MHEIEIVTKMTNDFICDSNGVIVTEYCKKALTWETFRDTIEYKPSNAFIRELISSAEVKEAEQTAKSDQKEETNLQDIMAIVNRGAEYWQNLVKIAKDNRITPSYQELTAVKQLIDMAETGKVPITSSGKVPSRVIKAIQIALELEDKLKTEGLLNKQ